MAIVKNLTSLARIEVQQCFCDDCSVYIKKKMHEIKDIYNVRMYPKKSMITFNFMKSNKLSSVLNVLTEIGYPEKGEQVNRKPHLKSLCGC